MAKLTNKQRAFVEHYLDTWNATEAAREAGYSERSIGSIASENLHKPAIKKEILQRLSDKAMAAMRSSSILAIWLGVLTLPTTCACGTSTRQARRRGKTHT